MVEIKCPKCGCFDAESLDFWSDGFNVNANYELCESMRCDQCGCEYDVRYVAVEIKQIN